MILFGTNDVGPAKYLASLARIFDQKIFFKCSSLNYFVFKEYKSEIIDDYSRYDFDIVVTGTSLGQSIDKELIIWAKERHIPSISIVEHWSWYRKRFLLNDKYIFPDYIILNDKFALKEAVIDGLDKNILFPLGNPYLEELSNRNINVFEKEKYYISNKIPKNKRIILFISESLCGPLALELGYDEYQVISSLKRILSKNDFLIIKIHPEENISKYNIFQDDSTKIISENLTPEFLSILGDKIIGMASMLLLEISFFRKDIISFRPNSKKQFIGQKLGVTNDAVNIEELKILLNTNINTNFNLKDHFKFSAKNIREFILSKML